MGASVVIFVILALLRTVYSLVHALLVMYCMGLIILWRISKHVM